MQRDDGDVAAEATSKADTAHGALSVQGTQFGNMPPALPVSIEAAPATPLPPSKTSLMAMLRDPDLKGTCIAVFVLCFTAVLREGLECFVFLGVFSFLSPGVCPEDLDCLDFLHLALCHLWAAEVTAFAVIPSHHLPVSCLVCVWTSVSFDLCPITTVSVIC